MSLNFSESTLLEPVRGGSAGEGESIAMEPLDGVDTRDPALAESISPYLSESIPEKESYKTEDLDFRLL